ncbi:MAG: CheR family methyltransferase [Clostridiales bacterium]
METLLSEREFREISRYISENLGLYFAPDRQPDLERGLMSAGLEAGFEDVRLYVDHLLKSPIRKEQTNLLALKLTIGETYFFRENRIFEILKSDILPPLLKSKEKIRIWCAGCCTGEEPYSVAIAVDEMFPEERKKDVSILGTDINTEFLKKAEEGIYGQWSFRNVPERIKSRYFTNVADKKFKIIPQIKKMVGFSYLNLIEDVFPSLLNETNAMDVIFCRNVLLYFNKEGAIKVLDGFFNSLVEGGWFIPGMSELSHLKSPKFQSVNYPDSILYRKVSIPAASAAQAESHHQEDEKNREDGKSKSTLASPRHFNPTLSRLKEALSAKAQKLSLAKMKPSHAEKIEPGHEKSVKEENKSATFNSARSLFEAGDYAGSAKELEYLFGNKLLLKSEIDKSYIMISKCYANLGDILKAKKWCSEGLKTNKLNPILYLLMCNLLQEENKIAEATDAVKKAIYLNPDYIMAHFALANIYRRSGGKKEALRHHKIALDILNKMGENDIVQGSEGLSAGRLKEIILSSISEGSAEK